MEFSKNPSMFILVIVLAASAFLIITNTFGFMPGMMGFATSGHHHEMQTHGTQNYDHGCCMDPPCVECFEERGYCDCGWREAQGLPVCDECEAHGCGRYDKDMQHTGDTCSV
jgi:hypothetical protein